MFLYSPNITPRLRYIVDFIGKEIFDEPIVLTSDKTLFAAEQGPRINYSGEEIADSDFFIRPVPLLFETGIRPLHIECFELNFHKAFFETGGDFPFDIFAASFYLLTRYEEYLPHEKDRYGRYAHTNSLAYRENFLDLPLVNIWIGELKKALTRKFPGLAFRYASLKFIPTYDIDIAYSYRHKEWTRNLGGLARDFFKGDWPAVSTRIAVWRGAEQDPYDAYEWLDSLHLYCRMKACYFFLVAGHQKGVDRNIPIRSPALQELLRYHAAGYKTGIHPSWQSGDEEYLLKEEIEWMEYITDKKIVRSRQHYIRFTLPGTYRQLIKYGIGQDYSMGYGTINGFRASVASSFYWYDIEREETTDLRLFPFCFMDATSFYEQKYSATQAMKELMHYYHIIRKVSGLMITVWHNSFLGTDPIFEGWREVYEVFLKEEVYWDM